MPHILGVGYADELSELLTFWVGGGGAVVHLIFSFEIRLLKLEKGAFSPPPPLRSSLFHYYQHFCVYYLAVCICFTQKTKPSFALVVTLSFSRSLHLLLLLFSPPSQFQTQLWWVLDFHFLAGCIFFVFFSPSNFMIWVTLRFEF